MEKRGAQRVAEPAWNWLLQSKPNALLPALQPFPIRESKITIFTASAAKPALNKMNSSDARAEEKYAARLGWAPGGASHRGERTGPGRVAEGLTQH